MLKSEISKLQVPLEPHALASSSALDRTIDLDPGSESARPPISYYLSLIRRHRWRILTFVVFVTVLTTLVALSLPKEYEATVTLQIDAAGAHVVGENNIQRSAQIEADALVNTDQQVLSSPAVVVKAIEALDLGENPEFKKLQPPGRPISEALIRAVANRIRVTRPPGTLLLELHYRTHSPELSSQIANELAHEFLALEYASRTDSLNSSAHYMTSQLNELRAQMEQSQRKLVDYESHNDILDPDDKNNVMLSRLSQINADYGKAQTDRTSLQALYETLLDHKNDAAVASDYAPALRPYQDRLQQDQTQFQATAMVYGPNSKKYQQDLRRVNFDKQQIQQVQQKIIGQVKTQYQAARAREQLLGKALAQQKADMDAFNLRAIQYHSLKAAFDSYSKLYYSLLETIQQANIAAGFQSSDARIVSPARESNAPVFPRIYLSAAIAFFLSSLLGIGAAIGLGELNQTISSPEQAELRFNTPVVGTLPSVSARAGTADLSLAAYARGALQENGNALQRRSSFQEAILTLHSSVLFSLPNPPVTLAMVSSLPSEGKSTVASHLSAAFAAMSIGRVILIDADMRRPKLHRNFGVSNKIGLSNVLRGEVDWAQAIQTGPDLGTLNLLTAGPSLSNPVEYLHRGIGELIDQLRAHYDYIIFDCPPVLGFADASTIANNVDAVLFIVHAGNTESSHIAGGLRQLSRIRANLLGIVLNQVDENLDSYYNYYKTYSNKYYARQEDPNEE